MAGTIRISSPEKIGIPGVADSTGTFAGAVAIGHLTVSGKVARITRSLPVAAGHLTVSGKTVVRSGATIQQVTITSLVSVGVSATLYDALDPAFGLIPTIGDIFTTPRFSTDGGTIVLSVDGRFEVGAPTSGFDSIPGVLYFSIRTGLTYGPVTLTILNPTLVLAISRGHLNVQGKQDPINRNRAVSLGHLVVFGHQNRIDRTRAISSIGHLTLTGETVGKIKALTPAVGHLTISGKTLTLSSRLTLQFNAGHLTVTGRSVNLTKSLQISVGHLTIHGDSVGLALGVPYFVTPGHLSIIGATVRLGVIRKFTPGHLTVHGKSVSATSTGAVAEIDKPGIRRRGVRRNIVSSEVG